MGCLQNFDSGIKLFTYSTIVRRTAIPDKLSYLGHHRPFLQPSRSQARNAVEANASTLCRSMMIPCKTEALVHFSNLSFSFHYSAKFGGRL
ncbi:hypothetical protein HDF17_002253 [Granulicella arctica]|uniref:Uncharacterized protein n=1 Tax=Granulicella arctica TaxID=940613 RepID=A0A7Y9TTG3_9BACT|nr:hypothetical protein [Granulicella arctica]